MRLSPLNFYSSAERRSVQIWIRRKPHFLTFLLVVHSVAVHNCYLCFETYFTLDVYKWFFDEFWSPIFLNFKYLKRKLFFDNISNYLIKRVYSLKCRRSKEFFCNFPTQFVPCFFEFKRVFKASYRFKFAVLFTIITLNIELNNNSALFIPNIILR